MSYSYFVLQRQSCFPSTIDPAVSSAHDAQVQYGRYNAHVYKNTGKKSWLECLLYLIKYAEWNQPRIPSHHKITACTKCVGLLIYTLYNRDSPVFQTQLIQLHLSAHIGMGVIMYTSTRYLIQKETRNTKNSPQKPSRYTDDWLKMHRKGTMLNVVTFAH